MSDGPVDPLDRVVRLGGREKCLEGNEALPLMTDDIRINVDDGRAAATLKVQARVSQLIARCLWFARQAHLAALAQSCAPKGRLWLHPLDSGPSHHG